MITKDPDSLEFDCIIVSPDETLYQGKAIKLQVPGTIQELAILPDHTPIYAELIKGSVTITPSSGQITKFSIESGVLRFRSNKASIVTGFGGKSSQLSK
jgi:F-type H+-transporting ATPase subunit epsilon